MEEQNQQPTPQPEEPKKKIYKKWWLWVLTIIILGFFVGLLSLYIWSDIDYPCSLCEAYGQGNIIEKINKNIYDYKCEKAGRIIKEIGWSGAVCFERSDKANQNCIQNSDCDGGACEPSAWTNLINIHSQETELSNKDALRINNDGYVLGTCSDAKYRLEPYSGDDMPCGLSLTIPTKTPPSSLSTLFCD
ncbi:MAG: hypothetical protein ACNFW9_04515 [Candidatus Kerfeldbacteria bacterium]